MDWNLIIMSYARDVIWVFVAAIAMSVSLGIVLKVYDWMTPNINEAEELKKGNIAVGIVVGSLMIAYGFVVGMVLHGR